LLADIAFQLWAVLVGTRARLLQLRAEQSNRPGASQQGMAVVSEGALERTRGSSLPEALSDKQVHTHTERGADKSGHTKAIS
jgi:hypothetical protein